MELRCHCFNGWCHVSCWKGEASSGKHVTSADAVRNLEWATSTCVLGFNVFGKSHHTHKRKEKKIIFHLFSSSCPFLFYLWYFVALFDFKGSGQRVLMAQTLTLYADHMTITSLPQLMILAKCTCSLTPVPSQGWDFLLFYFCWICHSIK